MGSICVRTLAETNKKNTVDLVNTHHLHSSSDDEDDRLKEFNFPEEAVLQQAFMDFQMQRMTSAFIDHFGFNDEEFGEQEESVNAPFDKTANITFSLNADDENPNANLLEICYKDRIQQFDDEEEEEEEGQGSAESDGEYGAWQGSQPVRASQASQPLVCGVEEAQTARRRTRRRTRRRMRGLSRQPVEEPALPPSPAPALSLLAQVGLLPLTQCLWMPQQVPQFLRRQTCPLSRSHPALQPTVPHSSGLRTPHIPQHLRKSQIAAK